MNSAVDVFHNNYYITLICKLLFHLEYVRILGTNHCDKQMMG